MSTTEACGCCAGLLTRTPEPIGNRSGLSTIEYRVGTHPRFLASMLADLGRAGQPLAELTTREPDDFAYALLDAWAVVADILTFYDERLANESYLRTSQDRVSLQELGKLIGYQLDPGVAAQTFLAFSLEHAPQVPDAQSKEPGSTPPQPPSIVSIERGLRVQSVPGPDERPQTFETVEGVLARPEWNAMAASANVPAAPATGDSSVWLAGAALNLKPGDAILVLGDEESGDPWETRVLEDVIPDDENNRTEVWWSPELDSIDPPVTSPAVFVFQKRLNVFGHNAPMWEAMSTEFKEAYPDDDDDTSTGWPSFEISPEDDSVDVDGSHPDVVVGSWVVLSKSGARSLWQVVSVEELSRAEFAISGKVTRLGLTGGDDYSTFASEVRGTAVFAASKRLALSPAPDPSPVSGRTVDVDVDASEMEEGRYLILIGETTSGEDRSELARVASVSHSGDRWLIELESDLSDSYQRSTVVVYGNVAKATHGETVSEILGSGRAAEPFQTFALARSPLTHVQSSDPSGASSTLEVRVNGVEWNEAATMYGAEPTDHAYAVRVDQAGRRTVRFGDGDQGSRLPTGNQNVRAEYRHGLGSAGNLDSGSLSQLLDRPLGVKGVTNPAPATGGVDPETVQAARSTMPFTVRTMGRAVSLLDYVDFALGFTGVSKAHAAVLPLLGGRTIVLSVAFVPGTVSDPTSRLADLGNSVREFGDPQVRVEVLAHVETTFRLAIKVAVQPDHEVDTVLEGVRSAVETRFSFSKRQFTEAIHRSEVVATAHSVDGLIAVDVDRLYTDTTPDLYERLIPQLPSVTPAGAPQPAGLLVIADSPFDWLQEMT